MSASLRTAVAAIFWGLWWIPLRGLSELGFNAIEIDDCGSLLNKCCKKTVELNGSKMVAQLPEVMPAIKRRWRVKQNKDKAAAAFKSRDDSSGGGKKVAPMDQV